MIEVKNLSKIYNKGKRNEVKACDNISLKLEDTGLYAIFGKSGAGKSSFMNALGGLDNYSSGTISYDDKQFKKNVNDKCRITNIGYIFQNYLLDVNANVYENVAFGLKSIGIKDPEVIFNRTMTALANVGMSKYFKRNVTTLSGGQQQRVAIARAMAKGSKIILADEPTGNLDVVNTRLVMNILKELSKTRMVIIVTHEVDIVETYADKIIEINDGKIVKESKGFSSDFQSDDANKIFLKELPKVTTEIGGIVVEKYGADCPINIKVINDNGRLYLKSDNANLKIIDNNNEVELINDTREEYINKRKESLNIKLRNLEPIAPKNSGQVFAFKDCFALNKNHSVKQKVRNGFLATTLCLLVITIVFIFASWGASYKKLQVMDHYRMAPYLVTTLDSGDDYFTVINKLNEKGIEMTDVEFKDVDSWDYNHEPYKKHVAKIEEASFISDVGSNTPSSNVTTNILFKSDQKCIIGKSTSLNKDVLVTTGFLKSNIENINEYDYTYKVNENEYFNSVIGGYLTIDNEKGYRITGIVEDEFSRVYMNLYQYTTMYQIKNIKVLLPDEVITLSNGDIIIPQPDTLYSGSYDSTLVDNDVTFQIDGKEEKLHIKYVDTNDYQVRFTKATLTKFKEYLFLYSGNSMTRMTAIFNSTDDLNKAIGVVKDIISDKDSETTHMSILASSIAEKNDIGSNEKLYLRTMSIVLGVLMGIILLLSLLITIVNFMDKKKEVGLYRAIGVSKSNVIYKYFVENLVTVISWVFLIMVILGVTMVLCSYFPISKDIGFFNGQMLYMDWWQLLAMIGVIIPSLMLLSIIPPLTYIRKSPIEILANYDM